MSAPDIFEIVDRIVTPARSSEELADKWQFVSLFAREHWTGEMAMDRYHRSLAYHLAVTELPWALPRMREASQIRAEQIVSEFGWPDRDWLEGQIASWVYSLTPKTPSPSDEKEER